MTTATAAMRKLTIGVIVKVNSASARNPGGYGRVTAREPKKGLVHVDSCEFPGQEVTGWYPAGNVELYTPIPAEGKFTYYDRETRDWPMYLDGQFVGAARTEPEAQTTLDTLVDEIARHTRATTADMAADAAEETAPYPHLLGNEQGTAFIPSWPAPTRDALAAALDRAVTARIPIPRNTPEWDAAQVKVEAALSELETYSSAAGAPGLLADAARQGIALGVSSEGLCQGVPYAAMGDDPEREMRDAEHAADETDLNRALAAPLDTCYGYDLTPCPNPATQELRINIALNPDAPIDPELIRVCDDCATKWQRYVIPAGICCVCGERHDIQRCPQLSAMAGLSPIRPYDKGAGTGGNAPISFYKPGDYLFGDDPCTAVRAELQAVRNVLLQLVKANEAAMKAEDAWIQDANDATSAELEDAQATLVICLNTARAALG